MMIHSHLRQEPTDIPVATILDLQEKNPQPIDSQAFFEKLNGVQICVLRQEERERGADGAPRFLCATTRQRVFIVTRWTDASRTRQRSEFQLRRLPESW